MLDGNNGKERCGEARTLIRFEEHGVTTSEEVCQFPTVKHWFILYPSWTLAGINPKRNKVYALAKIYIKAYIIHDSPWKPKFLLTWLTKCCICIQRDFIQPLEGREHRFTHQHDKHGQYQQLKEAIYKEPCYMIPFLWKVKVSSTETENRTRAACGGRWGWLTWNGGGGFVERWQHSPTECGQDGAAVWI